MYKPNSTWTWAFVGVTGVQAAIIIAFQSYVFALFQEGLHRHRETTENANKDYEQTIPTFLTLYIFGLIYELVLVWDALRLKNTIQVIGLCIYNLGLVIYAAVQLTEIHKAIDFFKKLPSLDPHFPYAMDSSVWPSTKPFLIAIPIIIAIGTLAMGFIARKLYDEFAWTIYKHISADLRMKRRYLTYQIYIAFLKFDFFFFLGFTIQLIVIVQAAHQKDYEFYLTIAAIPVTIGILLLAGIVTRKESKVGTGAIIFLYFAGLAYFIFKCVRMYGKGNKAAEYTPAKQSLTTFAVLTIACLVATIVNAFACLLNYDHGLRPYIAHRKVESEDEKPMGNGSQMEMPHLNYASGPATTRMEID